MIVPAVYVHCGFGALLAALSAPLAMRRVPMNRAYGIRVSEAFTSDACWYDINAYGGRLLFGYGVVLVAFGLYARRLAPAVTSPWSPVFVAGPLALVLVLLVPIRAYARRRAREDR